MSEVFVPMSFVPETSLNDLCANERAFLTNELALVRHGLGLSEEADFDYVLREPQGRSVDAYLSTKEGIVRVIAPGLGSVAVHEVNRAGEVRSVVFDSRGNVADDQQLAGIEKLGILRHMRGIVFDSADRALEDLPK